MTTTPVVRVIDCHVARETTEGWQYLVLRRAENRSDAGRWRIVTGKIEVGETAWQAALRELREETTLEAQRLFAVPYINQFYEWQHDRTNAIPVFLAIIPADAPIALDDEHVESRWLIFRDAVAALSWPAMRDGLRVADAVLTDPRTPVEALEIELPSA